MLICWMLIVPGDSHPGRCLHALAALDDQTLITAWSLNEEQNLGSVGCYGSVDHVESGKSI